MARADPESASRSWRAIYERTAPADSASVNWRSCFAEIPATEHPAFYFFPTRDVSRTEPSFLQIMRLSPRRCVVSRFAPEFDAKKAWGVGLLSMSPTRKE